MSITIDDIFVMWQKDGELDVANISQESAITPKLHNKYYHMYVQEGLRLRKQRAEYKQLLKLKTEYYKGELDNHELKDLGWDPQPLKILRQDIPMYIEADQDIINATLRIAMQEEKVNYLESIIKEIQRRSFHIKNIIDFERFKTGAI